MSEKPKYAFPSQSTAVEAGDYGMTLRDYLAGQIATGRTILPDYHAEWAEGVYAQADALLAARENPNPTGNPCPHSSAQTT